MNAIVEIQTRLDQRGLRYELSRDAIVIPAIKADGFAIRLQKLAKGYEVAFEGWHEQYQEGEEAVNAVTFGLSRECRLKIDFRGSFPYRWTVESQAGALWMEHSSTGVLLFPFWRRHQARYFTNHQLDDTL